MLRESSRDETGSTKSHTNPYATEVIRIKRKELVEGISNTEGLLDLLINHGAFSPEKKLLVSRIHAQVERNSKMLNMLIYQGERACRIFFYPCLKQAEPDLYHMMRRYVGGVNEGIRDPRRQLIGYLIERDKQGTNPNSTDKAFSKTSQKASSGVDTSQKIIKDETKVQEPLDLDHNPTEVFKAVAAGDVHLLEKLWRHKKPNAVSLPYDDLLHVAAEHGQLASMELLLHCGAQLTATDGRGRTALHVAAESGDVGATAALVKSGADIYTRDHASNTPLHLAVQRGHQGVVQALVDEEKHFENRATFLHMAAMEDDHTLTEVLLKTGTEVDSKDVQKKTALFHAVSRGNERTTALLLRAGARVRSGVLNAALDLNRRSMLTMLLQHSGGTVSPEAAKAALFEATRRNLDEAAAALVDVGTDVNARDSLEYTPLLLAAELGHVEVFRVLVSRNANLGRRLPDFTTVLHLAAQSGSVTIAQVLLDSGFDPDTTGPKDQTPLHVAALHNQPAVASLLLLAGARVDAVTHDGHTALHLASRDGRSEVASQLVQAGADLHVRDKQGRTALHLAAPQGEAAVARLLASAGAECDAADKEKKTPLHLAARWGRTEVMSALLAGKAKVGARDMDGCTALHYAAASGHADGAALLLATGKNKNADEKNARRRTPLHAASEQGHKAVVDLLLRSGAKINSKDGNKDTPLHCASRSGHVGAVQTLVNWLDGQRADLQATNNVNRTPLQVAEAGDLHAHELIATLLKKKMCLIK
ncbi:CARD- and ANK-domain containing inflammasome adapter protein [Denticeps clupeoides]|uniref:CARD- and ANK-containing Inflammasome Adaptor Protein n=1 Tax=Denticeps clupeoides TaxID=299321 RepID=A0AAY4CW27_9TELE|nr:ankyrin-1-like [Denticeps clupeoides]